MLAVLAAVAAGVFGCRSPIAYQVEPTPAVVGCPASGCAPAADQIAITYLGVGGFLVRYRGAALLTAPFFTNPRFLRVASLPPVWNGAVIRSDTNLIMRLLPAEADAASMILVGHSHYDHLMDVPFIAGRRVRNAKIYGGPTMRHILMADPVLQRRGGNRLIPIQGDSVGSATCEGTWFYSADSTFRVMALESDHAPTFRILGWEKHFARGPLKKDLTLLPSRAGEWKGGEVLSFLIDVLDRGQPRLRIYYQSSASTPPLGFPPRSVLDERPVDVALLAAAASTNVKGGRAPERLLEYLRPAYVLVGHWESFFRPQTRPIKLSPATKLDEFFDALHRSLPVTSGWHMPLPRTTVRFDLR